MGGFDYAALREMQRQELSSPRLAALDENFYTQIALFLSEKKNEALSSNSMLKVREYENLQRIIASIKEKREEKILLMALRGEKINGSATPEELTLFNNLVNALKEFREKITGTIKVISSDATHEKNEQKDGLMVRIIKDIEAYKGLDGNVYGPFKADTVISLPRAEVEWLVKAKMAEISR
ncbi:MAG: hypothetical protein QW590_03885 [Candidatus Bilamarchaeaceae archaeon]